MPELPKDQKLTTRQVQNLRARAASHAHQVIVALGECVAGTRRLSGTQVAAARVLLAKCLPDLQSVQVEHTGESGLQISIVRHSEQAQSDDTAGSVLPHAHTATGAPPRLQAVTLDAEAEVEAVVENPRR